jgi:hypothetical protein
VSLFNTTLHPSTASPSSPCSCNGVLARIMHLTKVPVTYDLLVVMHALCDQACIEQFSIYVSAGSRGIWLCEEGEGLYMYQLRWVLVQYIAPSKNRGLLTHTNHFVFSVYLLWSCSREKTSCRRSRGILLYVFSIVGLWSDWKPTWLPTYLRYFSPFLTLAVSCDTHLLVSSLECSLGPRQLLKYHLVSL